MLCTVLLSGPLCHPYDATTNGDVQVMLLLLTGGPEHACLMPGHDLRCCSLLAITRCTAAALVVAAEHQAVTSAAVLILSPSP